ncbi:MAG: S-adenosyl-l-methionine hydroxide adenosyltransferase family protein [Thermoanaerobaculia bacterium]
MGLVTLLTDFGTADYYVAAVRGTLLRLAPGARLVDLSHELPPGDVEGAAGLLAAAAPTFPRGTVHLAVVDPGVGGERRILVVEGGGHRFVAPDNGLLTHFLAPADDPPLVVSVKRHELFLPSPGATFHGRDRFAPVAAALLRGEEARGLGPPIGDPVRLPVEPPRREILDGGGTVLRGRVTRVDRFGNLVTDLPADWIPAGVRPIVEVAQHSARRWVTHYAELAPGEPGALVGSLGTVELSLREESLAARWAVDRGAAVRILLPD